MRTRNAFYWDITRNIINWFRVYLYSVKSLAYKKCHCATNKRPQKYIIYESRKKGSRRIIFGAVIEISRLRIASAHRRQTEPFISNLFSPTSSRDPCRIPPNKALSLCSIKNWENIQIWCLGGAKVMGTVFFIGFTIIWIKRIFKVLRWSLS